MTYRPPFKITPKILQLSAKIAHILGKLSPYDFARVPIKLRRENKIRTIHASLVIEGNRLTLAQVSDLIEGIPVVGPSKDILEVKNAIALYEDFDELNPFALKDLLRAHKILMKDLVPDQGSFRQGDVGIFAGKKLVHAAPPAKRLPALMKSLFSFIQHDHDIPMILKACIFHYEFEFIHPFIDGNGRIGRLWQQLLLAQESHLFKYIAVEEMIKENQEAYYKVLGECDRLGDSTAFIDFSLELILKTLQDYAQKMMPTSQNPTTRLTFAAQKFGENWFTRKEYGQIFATISSSTASRDLDYGVKEKMLEKKGEKNQTRYRYQR